MQAIITGTMANPSSPSVRFTALEAPTITKHPKGRKKTPRLIVKSFKNGMARPVSNPSLPEGKIPVRNQHAIKAIANSRIIFIFPLNPFGLCLDTFRKSS